MSDNKPEGLYCRYLRLFGERRRAEGSMAANSSAIDEAKEEQYWRDRNRWQQQQQTRKAA
jgi:hypothetical protein